MRHIENPQKEKGLHIAGELVAVAVVAPITWIISENKNLKGWQSRMLKGFAVGTVLVDGYLLWRWAVESAEKK